MKTELSLNPNSASVSIIFFPPRLPQVQQRNSGGRRSNLLQFQWRWYDNPLRSNILETHIITELKKNQT